MDRDSFMQQVTISNERILEPLATECWDWTGARASNGYGRHNDGEYAHRTSYSLFVGPIPDGLFVLHHCDRPICVRPAHLYVGTHRDNMRDMIERGRQGSVTHPERVPRGDRHGSRLHPETHVRGAAHPLGKLTDDAVRSIRRRYPRYSATLLAAEFGVDRNAVYNAAIGKTWAHITDVAPVEPSYRKGHGRARDRQRIEARGEEWPLLERKRETV